MTPRPDGAPERHVLLFFIDGIGVGGDDPGTNPLATGDFPTLHLTATRTPRSSAATPFLAHGLDSTLGVPGLPQSATGQTALLTGVNAPSVMGMHISGFPGPGLTRILLEHSILKRLRHHGRTAVFLNAFRPAFFDAPEARRRLSATSLATLASGAPFRTWEDLLEGRAVVHDLTHWRVRERGYDLPERSPEEAGAIIARETMRHDFSLFEYFETDRAGHDQDRERALRCLGDLDRALQTVLANIDPATTTVFVASDHGNLEDGAVKTHTRNPAFFAAWGAETGPRATPGRRAEAGRSAARPEALTDLAPLVLETLGVTEAGRP